MKTTIAIILLYILPTISIGQSLKVVNLIPNINASGGVLTDQDGNVYISDFGPRLGIPIDSAKVYKWNVETGEISVFVRGLKGASGACFDDGGNFYQSNPFGNSITKVVSNGKVIDSWATNNIQLPVGLAVDKNDNIYVCNCGSNTIAKVSPMAEVSIFASSELFKCPNGMTIDDDNNLYVCNFNDGKVLKIDQAGKVSIFAELPVLTGGPSPVGNGHLTWKNGNLFVTTIGTGEVYLIKSDGSKHKIAGKAFAMVNSEGDEKSASFSKPNGIAASITGDTLYINVSDPAWNNDPTGLHPAHLFMISGVCSLDVAECE